jgi:hypothetical protein
LRAVEVRCDLSAREADMVAVGQAAEVLLGKE